MTTPAKGSVFITGAAGGLGRAFAAYYAGLGHPLVLSDVRADGLAEVARTLEPHGVEVRLVVADLGTRAGLDTAVQAVRDCADLEILINNAGLGGEGDPFEADLDYLCLQIDVNARAPLCLSLAAVPGMRARRRGAIVNVASLAGIRPNTAVALNYASTKGYVIFMTQTLHGLLYGSGIHVQALCPGLVDTPINKPELKRQFGSLLWTTPELVAAVSHRALGGKNVLVLPGLNTRLIILFGKLGISRWVYAALRRYDRLMRKLGRLPPLDLPPPGSERPAASPPAPHSPASGKR